MGSTPLATYTLRADREQLRRLTEIAAAEHRSLVQKLRVMIDAEIAQHDREPEAVA